MKKIVFISFLSIGVLFSIYLYAQNFWGGETLTAKEVKAKWGEQVYDAKRFKDGDMAIRSSMAYSIMTDKKLIGKSYKEIRELFGRPEGYYFIDAYPAYIIQRGKNQNEDTWQIVFRMNNGFSVRDIIMHKNCCDKK